MSCWPLAEISVNSNQKDEIEDRFELTSNWCSHIVDHACDDQSLKIIAEDLQMLLSTIYSTISHNKSCYDNESLHWSDCSNIVSDSLYHCLLHEVHVNSKIWYRDLWLNLDLHEKTVSKFFLYHVLKNEDITNWLVKKRSQLISEVTVKHLQFAKDHEHWDSNKWKIFLWSDECSVKHDSDRKQQWMFHTSAQKWDREMIQFYNKDKNKSVMIWACFENDSQKSDLVFISDNSNTK